MRHTIASMDLRVIGRNVGEVLELFSLLFLIPLIYVLVFEFSWTSIAAFSIPMAFGFSLGILLKAISKTNLPSMRHHALISIAIVWVLCILVSGLPFTIGLGKNLVDSTFQATSALTTTGLDVFHNSAQNLSTIPRVYVLWMNFLSWIGGAGVVMIALVGLISVFESGKLASAEGLENRIKPNIIHTSRIIWEIYLVLTGIGVILLLASGMNLFDAVNYAMGAISTGGFGTGDNALITNPAISAVIAFISILGAISFFAHYMAYKKDKTYYFKDVQILVMLLLIILGTFLVLPLILDIYFKTSFRIALFNTISALTCGGMSSVDLSTWVSKAQPALLVFAMLMFIGGSAGSTAGGIKISRLIILAKTIVWRIRKSMLPEDAVVVMKFEGKPVDMKVVNEIVLFVALYAIFIFIGSLVLTYTGYGFTESVFETISAQSNVGLSIITGASMPVIGKLMLMINMIVGRLEIIPFLTLIGFVMKILEG